jgi:hypothetical protein
MSFATVAPMVVEEKGFDLLLFTKKDIWNFRVLLSAQR